MLTTRSGLPLSAMQAGARRTLMASLLMASVLAAAAGARAQDATPASAPAAAPADAAASAPAAPADAAASAPAATGPVVNGDLKSLADDFLHYSLVGRTDLAHDSAQAILNSNPSSTDLLNAFEAAANNRNVEDILLRNQRNDALKDVSNQLRMKLEEGHRQVARDPARIKDELDRLGNSTRAYVNARARLQAAGEYAVPFMINYLLDPSKKDLHPYILQVMTEIGRPLLPAILEELKTPDTNLKISLVNVLGNIGYPQSLPYLKEIQEDKSVTDAMRKAAAMAYAQCDPEGRNGGRSASELYYNLGQGYYQQKPSLAPSHPTEATNPVWFFDKGLNDVTGVPVPTAIWYDVSAKRSAENSLRVQPNYAPSISLWLASDLRRETHLPAGAEDPTHAKDAPDAHYYAVTAGPAYLNPVLAMALNDKDTPLALKTIQALEETGATQSLEGTQDAGAPLVRAMLFPDRAIRVPAAIAVARSNPSKPFAGSYRVVPVLAEAINAGGLPTALLVGDADNNAVKDALRDKYLFVEGATLDEALSRARDAAAIDLVVVHDGPEAVHTRQAEIPGGDPKLFGAATLAIFDATDAAAPVRLTSQFAHSTSFVPVPSNADAGAIQKAVAQATATGQSIDPKVADDYALTSARLLGNIARDHASVFDIQDAVPTLVGALKSKRPELVTAVADTLGAVRSKDAQNALAQSALTGGGDAPIRSALFVALSESAKHTGNALDAKTVDALIKEVSTETEPTVRGAAAEALGALNVPSNQASQLILQQAKE